MITVDLKAKNRDKSGKGCTKRLRKSNEVPGVVYGKGLNNTLVEFSEMELNDVLKKYGEHAVLNLDIGGSKVKTIIKEVQRDPIDRRLSHVDLKFVKDGEKVHADIPVVLKGESNIKSKGGIIQKQLVNISIESIPEKLPQYFIADVSKLNIGDKITVADVEFSSDITLMTDINSIIASVTSIQENPVNTETQEQTVSNIAL